MTSKLMMAVLALAWATNVTAAGDTPQNVASEGMSLWVKVESSVAPVLLLYGGQGQTVPLDRKCFDNFFAQYSFLWYYIGGLSGPEEI